MKRILSAMLALLLLFAGCAGQWGVRAPKTLHFSARCVLDLTDKEGGTLHCGGANEFYGTIDGEFDGMLGIDEPYLQFHVPYSEEYRFESKAETPVIRCENGNSSQISCDRKSTVLWTLNSWTIQAEDVNVELTRYQENGRNVKVSFHADGPCQIRFEGRQILLEGASGEAGVTVYDLDLRKNSQNVTWQISGDVQRIDLSQLSDSKLLVEDGENSQSWNLMWLDF